MTDPGTAIPTLPSRDLDATARFYAQLGFREQRRWEGEYLVVVRDALELHFFRHADVDPATTIAGCYLRIADADVLYAELASTELRESHRGWPRLHGPPETTDYGLREFAVVDPDGSLLRIGSPAG